MLNNIDFDLVILLLLSTIILSIVMAVISIKIAPKVGLMDYPDSAAHKIHKNAIPLTGGIVIIDALLIICLTTGIWDLPETLPIIISGIIITIFGLIDDFVHLSPPKKIIGQLCGATILIYLGVQINIFDSPGFFYRTETNLDSILNYFFTIFWLITLTNAFNFIDSIDGLVLGISGLSTACFLVMSISTGQENLVYFCSILLGVCIGIYFFNAFPAKLFLGDSGAQTLGFILASVAIVFRPDSGSQSSTWFAPVLLFYVPLFDLILVVVSRIRRKKRIYKASKDHTYHRLVSMGFSKQHAVLLLHGICLCMSMVGYLCLNLPVANANIIFLFSILLGASAIVKLENEFNSYV